MKITYNSNVGQPLTTKQLTNITDYRKLYFPDNSPLIKRTDDYIDSALIMISYYLDAGESEADIVASLSVNNCPFFVISRETYLTYTIEHRNGYNGTLLTSKSEILFDAQQSEMAYQVLALDTGLPDAAKTEKLLGQYIDSFSANYCVFRYNPDGSLAYCDYNYLSERDGITFDATTISGIRDYFTLTDTMYNYYLTADFTPPSS